MLTTAELSRYSRHLSLPEFGRAGQEQLRASRVLIVGAGGLGSPLGLYLAAAGVGILGIVDGDVVEESNLQRQVLYTVDDIGQPKAERAAARLNALNPHVDIRPYTMTLSSENALGLIKDYDLVIDGTDNFPTRYLTNDACVLAGKPNVYGSIFQFEGQASVFHHEGGPCYRCLFPEPPPPGMVPSCAEGGVLGVLPAMIAGIQATEAIKILTGMGDTLSGRLLQYNALSMTFDELRLRRDPECPVCGDHPSITALIDYDAFCGVPKALAQECDINPEALNARLQKGEQMTLIDVREPYEREICAIDGSLHIPLQSLPARIHEFSKEQTLVFYCKSGGRSAGARQLFSDADFHRVYNLSGGILAWADKIDPDMPRY
ncbi:Dinucleotide-utilizing enzyme involved in molybdopterin and thiamine biosynthesis family 2 [Hahella chejuensis KCTC 2396]|uniref:Molybdopterin-synthase adenylyltransferase n=1 Tax=Hahella chejuensis (strain KCTC 2396) TaxID=349521 RepID=Q2SEW5_HAHCH|nr:molybdopterin-synthase adenylyltransferase MoeB [Hahella chejuensis]ABC30809.1 Dinucleotide-utilizing enzyme involved in molybdopterin and thiamine biosynthesis family 2 [Hahella chejuensis KCTC 2396]